MIHIAKPWLGEEEKEAVSSVIDSGMIACGSVVTEFEEAFATYCQAKHGIATTSGTTALEVGIRSLGLGEGDKILTTAFSFIASTNAIIYTGASPVFADIDPITFNIDYEKIEEILSVDNQIKALLIVHLFGRPCDMNRISQIVKKYDLLLIEDCAQAHGATYNGKKVGSFGDVSAFSFYPTKNMTTGEGGMVLTSNDSYADKARLLISHGMKVRYYHEIIGYNYRMTNISAAIGLCQLKKLTHMNERRVKNAKYYSNHITNDLIILPEVIEGHVFHQYTIRVVDGKREAFVEYLTLNGIGHGVFYPLTIPEQSCYDEFGFIKVFEFSDRIKNEVTSLPIHPQLTDEELEKVATVINNFQG